MIGKNVQFRVRVSDFEHMGADFRIGRMVDKRVFSRRYECQMQYEGALFYVYVRYGVYSGARISGIAVSMYDDRQYALLACKRLNDCFQEGLRNNKNNIRRKQRERLWGQVAAHLFFLLAVVMMIPCIVLLLSKGFSLTLFLLCALYSIVMGLCYLIHYRLQ